MSMRFRPSSPSRPPRPPHDLAGGLGSWLPIEKPSSHFLGFGPSNLHDSPGLLRGESAGAMPLAPRTTWTVDRSATNPPGIAQKGRGQPSARQRLEFHEMASKPA